MRDAAHVKTLRLVLRLGTRVETAKFIHHRRVTEIDHEIGLVGEHVGQRLLLHPHIRADIQM